MIERFVADDRVNQEVAAANSTTLPGYFGTLRIRMLQGRDFTPDDIEGQRPVVIVDERFANAMWPGESAIGRWLHIRRSGRDLASAEVIGVVSHVRAQTLRDDRQPQVYVPYHRYALHEMAVTIRTAGDPLLIGAAARREIEALGGQRPVYDIRLMRTYVEDAAAESRFLLMLLGSFGTVALLLAAVGLYGVISYSTGQRTREIGVRLALGAAPADILRLVIGDGVRCTGAGIAIGIVVSLVLTRSFERLLFGVKPSDPLTFATVTALLALVALLACWIPARRAARIDPALALQSE